MIVKATQVLVTEHKAVLAILKVLEKINQRIENEEQVEIKHLEQILEFIKVFVDECHHAKEEVYLIPTVVKLGIDDHDNLIKTILEQHNKGRFYANELKQAVESYKNGEKSALAQIVENAQSYINLLNIHIDKENNLFFKRSDVVLTDVKQEELYKNFEKIEEEKIGIGKHEEFHKMIDYLKGVYLTSA